MANQDEYDYNIWSQDSNQLCLTAYEWEYYNGLQTNTEKSYTIEFIMPEDIKEIEYLLNDIVINQLPLTDYDTWESVEFLTRGNTPDRIQRFLDELPAYEIKDNNNG